jgi:8-oxo-dGTP pyrophosphatase MutT (NUDIX family)
MSDIRAAGVIVYLQEKKERVFLLLRSAKNGEWGPPKGKTEAGETDMEAALREALEEAGLRRLQFKQGFRENIAYQVTKKGKVASKQVSYFLARIDSDEIELSVEHTEAHLATLDEIEQLVPHEHLREVFRRAEDYIKRAK